MRTLARLISSARGQHRAADRITALEAERDALLAQLVDTDKVVSRYASQRVHDAARIETLTANVDALTTENESLRNDWDELWARHDELSAHHLEVKARLQDLTAISDLTALNVAPTPLNVEALPPHLYDADGEDTQELPSPAVQKVIPLYEKTAA
jgi:chromosome segregation ATPase